MCDDNVEVEEDQDERLVKKRALDTDDHDDGDDDDDDGDNDADPNDADSSAGLREEGTAITEGADMTCQPKAKKQAKTEDNVDGENDDNDDGHDEHRRRKHNYARALQVIIEDYLGPDALHGECFKQQFRITKASFYRFMNDVREARIPYYLVDDIENHPCVEAKILLPLKTRAYGLPSYVSCPYFQMSFSEAEEACREFEDAILTLYAPEYLRDDKDDYDQNRKERGVKVALDRLKKLG